MRVIEADDLEPAPACRPPRREVIGGVDQEPRRGLVGEVARSDRLDNLVAAAQEQAAALGRRGFARVRARSRRAPPTTHSKFQIHNSKFSTAIAMPMPPPMQSDATP